MPAARAAALSLLLALLVVTAGCTAGGTRTPGRSGLSPGYPSGAPVGSLDEKRLRTALLDVADFPAGWAADSDRAAEERGRGVPEPEEATCKKLFAGTGDADVRADAGFLRSRFGPFVATGVAAYRGDGDARAALGHFERASRGCSRFRAATEDRTVTYTAAPLRLPSLGDGSRAVRFREKGEDTVVDVVLARVGSNVVFLAQAGRKDLDTGSVKPLARRAVAKLREVADGRTPVPDSSHPGSTEL